MATVDNGRTNRLCGAGMRNLLVIVSLLADHGEGQVINHAVPSPSATSWRTVSVVEEEAERVRHIFTKFIGLLRSVGLTSEMPEPSNAEPLTHHDEELIADFLRRHERSTEGTLADDPTVSRQISDYSGDAP
jgi:hypothetical protein